jgi:hypothetical protein
MNPLIPAAMPGIPGMSGGLNDSGSAVAGDIHGKNNNGGAIHFAPTWQGQLIWLGVAALGVTAFYLWKKK